MLDRRVQESYFLDKLHDKTWALTLTYKHSGAIVKKAGRYNVTELERFLDDLLRINPSTLVLTGAARITKTVAHLLKKRYLLLNQLAEALANECSFEEANSVLNSVS